MRMPHWPKPVGKHIVDLKLERVRELLSRLGNPQKKLPPVIHVAGTNGKGSTIAFLKTILVSAGYTVHQYISPHLLRFNERITLANEEITDHDLFTVLELCREKANGLDLTFFEATTVAAFLAFSMHQADVVLLETGLGGRLDATNVIEKPLISVITPIDLDHMEFLGDTVEKIAKEKAGIIKNRAPVVTSWQQSSAINIITKIAEKLHSPLFACGRDWHFQKERYGFIYRSKCVFKLPTPSLVGVHQIINAATAVAAVEAINDKLPVSINDIYAGLKKTQWPARMQKLDSGRLFAMLRNNDELWMDGAHNSSGSQMLAASLQNMPEKNTIIINGRSKGRDIIGFLTPFSKLAQLLIAVPVCWEPMSEDPKKIFQAAQKLGLTSLICNSVSEAVQKALQLSGKHPVRIIICGSLYLAGDVMMANKEEQ